MCITASNLDKTRTRIVRKGLLCDLGGLRFRVQRVRLGTVYGQTLIQKHDVVTQCLHVRVVA